MEQEWREARKKELEARLRSRFNAWDKQALDELLVYVPTFYFGYKDGLTYEQICKENNWDSAHSWLKNVMALVALQEHRQDLGLNPYEKLIKQTAPKPAVETKSGKRDKIKNRK